MSFPDSLITPVVGINFAESQYKLPPNALPVICALLGEPNSAEEPNVSLGGVQVTTAKKVAEICGYGSLPHLCMKVLENGNFPVYLYPQKYDTGTPPTATVDQLTITGTATGTAALYINTNGVKTPFLVETGDAPADIVTKILNAYNNVIDLPSSATDATEAVDFTTKWKGKTSTGQKISIEGDESSTGVTFAFARSVEGTGTPDVETSLNLFGSQWNNIVVNPYGADAFAVLEEFNGKPNTETPTGRWAPDVVLPYLSLFGSLASTLAEAQAITDVDARKTEVTNVACPAPGSDWYPAQASANMALLYGNVANSDPHLGVLNETYAFNVVPEDGAIDDMLTVDGRNAIASAGHSTADIQNAEYRIQDFRTTYHPDGDDSPLWARARDVWVDFNIAFFWKLKCQQYFVGRVIVSDNATPAVQGTIKLSTVQAITEEFISEMSDLAFVADPEFAKSTLQVSISPENRINVIFDYDRTSIAEQVDAEVRVRFFQTV